MKDVAREAGVSTSTVSHVVNNDRFVSEAVREKVERAIRALNYAPSALARSLKMNQTRTIGMLLSASSNPFYSEVVRGVERSCYERNYSLILCNTDGDEERMIRSLESLLQKRVDGLVIMCTESQSPSRKVITRYPSIPCVMMDWAPFDGDIDIIQDNSLVGGELATRFLIQSGYREIACIAGPQNKTPARLRLEGFRSAMVMADLPLNSEFLVYGDFEFSGGYSAMKQLLALKRIPEAVFTSNDAMAVGCYRAIHEAGLTVAKDIAVVGYDDIELARYLCPPLSTIHQPKDDLGELAIDTLLHRLTDPGVSQQVLVLTPELVVRDSVVMR